MVNNLNIKQLWKAAAIRLYEEYPEQFKSIDHAYHYVKRQTHAAMYSVKVEKLLAQILYEK